MAHASPPFVIGLLVDVFRGYSEQFWLAVAESCSMSGVHLVVMPLDLGINDTTTEHYNRMIFQCIADNMLDALIVLASTMAIYPDYPFLKKRLEQIHHIPVVGVGAHLEGFPAVLIDNEIGFRKLLNHLMEDHGCNKIAYINGVENHEDSIERLRVYLEAMAEHGLRVDPRWICPGDFNFRAGQEAAKYLFDNHIQVDAIAAANDKMALGAIQELQERGLRIPEDILVTGFDNILENQMSPSLTTVQQPFRQLAFAAVETVLRMLHGKDVPQVQYHSTDFIPQHSCGCIHDSHLQQVGDIGMHRFNRMIASLTVENLVTRSMNKMISALSVSELMQNVVAELPGMAISDCTVMLFEPNMQVSDKTPPDAYAALVYSEGKKQKTLEHPGWTFQEALRYQLSGEEAKTVVLLPLAYDTDFYGYMFLHNNAVSGWYYEAVHRQLCSALKVILLIERLAGTNAALDASLLQVDATNKQLINAMEEIQKTQTYLVETEKMAALGTLVAGMAHEINTPVGVSISAVTHLMDSLEVVQQRYREGILRKSDYEAFMDTTREACSIMEGNLMRAAELIRSFKEVAVDQSTDSHRNYRLLDTLRQILLSFQPQLKKTNIRVVLECAPEIELFGNPGEMMQILTNLLVNSLTHGYDEGAIGCITIHAELVKPMFRLFFSDDGKGIAEADLEIIFRPFFTTNRTGGSTGLGLNILYNLVVKKPGGKVSCASQLGQGVRFELEWREESEKGSI